ncbi:Uncharacterised protein [Enterobacter hormaechei]|nr:Uncharacterised protein [Enterobacter hormaechei]
MNIVFGTDPAKGTQVVIGLFIDHVNDLIDGQTPHQLAHRIHHRRAHQVITFESTRRFFGIVFRREDHRLGFHDLTHPLLGAVQQDRFQLQLPEQGFIPRGDEQFIGVVRHTAQATKIALHRTQGDVRTHGDDAKLHDRADAVFLVVHHLTHARPLFGRQGSQQASGQVARKMLNEVNLLIDIQRLQCVKNVPVAHLIDKVIPDVFRGFQQHLTALVILHQPPQGVALLGRQCLQGVRQIRRW